MQRNEQCHLLTSMITTGVEGDLFRANSDGAGTILKQRWGVRHVQVLMLALAMALCYAMRVNMSLAIVVMTDADAGAGAASFNWSTQTQSVILSSFFWGNIVLQIPSGVLANRFGGKVLVLICIAVNSAVSIVLPLVATFGWPYVCACRIVQGLSQGLLFPSSHNLIGKWVPIKEKSRLGTFVYSGLHLGTAIQNLSAGFIANAWGWPAIFYVNGVCGAVWVAAYIFLGAASPESSRLISAKEKDYIQNSLEQVGEQKKLQIPWKSICKSLPFLALLIVHCGQNWGFFTLMTLIPSYMSNVMEVNIKQNGVMSALPYFAIYVISFPVGIISDCLINRKILSTTHTRKLFNSIGLYGPALTLVGMSYLPSDNLPLAVAMLVICVGINAGHLAGLMLVHIDMSPNFAGILMGITNFFANIISLIAPLAAGAMLRDKNNPGDWRMVFFVAAGIYIAANTVFVLFGSSEKQQWNEVTQVGDNKQ